MIVAVLNLFVSGYTSAYIILYTVFAVLQISEKDNQNFKTYHEPYICICMCTYIYI